jgi:TrmH family RNA methyltransferase
VNSQVDIPGVGIFIVPARLSYSLAARNPERWLPLATGEARCGRFQTAGTTTVVKISETITSPANPRVKQAARLRSAAERRETGLTLVDGIRELTRAAAAGVAIEAVFVAGDETGDVERTAARDACLEACRSRGAAIVALAPRAFEKVAFGDRDEGLVGVVRFQPRGLADVAFPVGRPLLVAEAVEKPGNLGAILRTADAAGLAGVIACDSGTDVANPAVIRASLGTVFSVPLAVAAADEVIAWCREHRRRVVAATPEGTHPWHEVPLAGATVIVVGSEAHGLSPAWHGAALAKTITLETVSLPMRGIADSLNVSATAAVLAYEAVRQEGTP